MKEGVKNHNKNVLEISNKTINNTQIEWVDINRMNAAITHFAGKEKSQNLRQEENNGKYENVET